MGKIYVGTSGYSFKDWKGIFYPAEIKDGDMLSFYSQRFKVVEVNSTYYTIPPSRVFENMLKKTPDDFLFTVKANSQMTHERASEPMIFKQFEDSITPLVEAGRMKGILAQFPQSFKNNEQNRTYISKLRSLLTEYPLIVEFRHNSWIRPEVFDFLKGLDISYCVVDEPDLPGLVPAVVVNTNKLGYIRFHGRNKAAWWKGDSSERYNYLYSDQELKDWLPKVKQLSDATEETFVLFNNCHAGHAVRNAQTMQELIKDLFTSNSKESN